MKVDLPEPDGPMTAMNSPWLTCSETSRRAGTTFVPMRYSFESCSTWISGAVIGRLLPQHHDRGHRGAGLAGLADLAAAGLATRLGALALAALGLTVGKSRVWHQ